MSRTLAGHPAGRRAGLKERKRAVRQALLAHASPSERQVGSAAALELLAHSVQMGHDRLALIRLTEALRCGVAVPKEFWAYCESVAQRTAPSTLARLIQPLGCARPAECGIG